MATVAIAILNFNGEEHLARFLPSIIKYSGDHEVIIGDNGSTDGSLSLLSERFPSIKVVKFDKNYGFAGGYNKLIASIDQEYTILVNSDVEVTENWIAPLVTILTNDPSVAAVQPKILSYSKPKFFEYAGAGGGYIDKYGYPFCRGRIFNSLEEDLGQYNNECSVFWASGACFMVRTEVFKQLGGFDDSFFAHMEEIDLNWRMQNHGYGIKYTGSSKVFHFGGGTLAYSNPRKTYLNFRNSWAMIIKNHSNGLGFNILILRYLMDLASILFYLLQFQFSSGIAVIRAHFYIFSHYQKIKKAREGTRNIAKNSSIIKPESFSLVWQYFVRRKRKFSTLIPDRTPTT